MFRHRQPAVWVLAIVLAGGWPFAAPDATGRQGRPADRLTDAEFWQLVTDLSEPTGDFHADNFTSNERAYAEPAAALAAGRQGGAYIGVGPEQNFNYIAAMRPQIAFIVDIRRQALVQHLLYMALFDLSSDRADFVARLFSRRRPSGLPRGVTPAALWAAFPHGTGTDRELFDRNLSEVDAHLIGTRGIPLTDADRRSLAYVYNAFFTLGPEIHYGGYEQNRSTGGTNFALLAQAADSRGVFRSFLGTDAAFQFVKDMHARHLIVPVRGDFGGPRSIRGIGDYLRAHGLIVHAFYISNVEQYLFGQTVDKETDVNGGWRKFYENAATLPIDARSMILRSPSSLAQPTVSCAMAAFLKAFAEGRIQTRADATRCVT